jgi:hypothetical protein
VRRAARHMDGRPMIPRAYYRPREDRWEGYVGSDQPGASYGLCRPEGHLHRTQALAVACATRAMRDRTRFPRHP